MALHRISVDIRYRGVPVRPDPHPGVRPVMKAADDCARWWHVSVYAAPRLRSVPASPEGRTSQSKCGDVDDSFGKGQDDYVRPRRLDDLRRQRLYGASCGRGGEAT